MNYSVRNHILIAGTGRAGTTLLVQLLDGLGVETSIKKGNQYYSKDANAGYEDSPLGNAQAPYVCKSPWLYEYFDEILKSRDIVIDALILPMRNLYDAAQSRIDQEIKALYKANPKPFGMEKTPKTWARTPGGAYYFLDAKEQSKLLALNFYDVYFKALENNIKVVPLIFPRFCTDFEYFYRKIVLDTFNLKIHKETVYENFVNICQPDKISIKSKSTSVGNICELLQRNKELEFKIAGLEKKLQERNGRK